MNMLRYLASGSMLVAASSALLAGCGAPSTGDESGARPGEDVGEAAQAIFCSSTPADVEVAYNGGGSGTVQTTTSTDTTDQFGTCGGWVANFTGLDFHNFKVKAT